MSSLWTNHAAIATNLSTKAGAEADAKAFPVSARRLAEADQPLFAWLLRVHSPDQATDLLTDRRTDPGRQAGCHN